MLTLGRGRRYGHRVKEERHCLLYGVVEVATLFLEGFVLCPTTSDMNLPPYNYDYNLNISTYKIHNR